MSRDMLSYYFDNHTVKQFKFKLTVIKGVKLTMSVSL